MKHVRSSLVFAVAGAFLAVASLTGCGTSGGGAGTGPQQTASSGGPAAGPAFSACRALTVTEVGAILGGTVTARDALGNTCWFQQADPKAPFISVTGGIPVSNPSGINASKAAAETQIDGKATDLAGVGDAAYIIVGKGKVIPTQTLQAAGGVVVKGQLITVALASGQDLTADQVTKMITDVVKLLAAKA